jgi:hypothetical protein
VRTETVISIFGISCSLYLVLVFLVMYLARTAEYRLIALGLLTAVLAVWCSSFGGVDGVSVQARPGQPGAEVGLSVGGGAVAGALGRIAVLLVLGGVASLVWSRWYAPAPPARLEEGIRADRI